MVLTMSGTVQMSEEYREVALNFFRELLLREQWVADVYGYWVQEPDFDQEFRDFRLSISKTSYDEARHANIMEKLVRHLGGQEVVDEMYAEWNQRKNFTWLDRMTRVFTKGIPNYTEFLSTAPLFADSVGVHFFADVAENTPDPLIADAVESISEDERLHRSLAAEYLPEIVEREGEAAEEKIRKGVELWWPVMVGIQGHPESSTREKMIDAGFVSLTNEDVHDLMRQQGEEVLDPLGIDIPELDDDEYLRAGEVTDYCERIVTERDLAGEI